MQMLWIKQYEKVCTKHMKVKKMQEKLKRI